MTFFTLSKLVQAYDSPPISKFPEFLDMAPDFSLHNRATGSFKAELHCIVNWQTFSACISVFGG
jgi:hypothetical protein